MSRSVVKAVIPAAGFGTRMLPFTKAVPKELIPLVDTPVLQYVVEEAVSAGAKDILIIISEGKEAIKEHFQPARALEERLAESGKHALLEQMQGSFSGIGIQYNMVLDTLYVIQTTPNGPSERAGILAGDKVVEVNDTVIAGVKMTRTDIMSRLRGKKGSQVKVGIVRRGINRLLEFNLVRDDISTETVDAAYMIDKKNGYIRRWNRTVYSEIFPIGQPTAKMCRLFV